MSRGWYREADVLALRRCTGVDAQQVCRRRGETNRQERKIVQSGGFGGQDGDRR
jgi:hypothetical protein